MHLKKKDNPPSLAEFNIILDGISHDGPTGHLFIVDIKFKNINPKTLFNELYLPIFEPNGTVWVIDSSTFKYYGQGWGQGENKFFPVHF